MQDTADTEEEGGPDLSGPNELLARTERERLGALANARMHVEKAQQLERQAEAVIRELGPKVRYGGGTYAERRAYTRAVAQKSRMVQVFELAQADIKRLEKM